MIFVPVHMLMHSNMFYKHVHKLHHTYSQPVSIISAHAHPIEFILGNLVPLGFASMLLGSRMHFFTFVAIGTTRILGTSIGHSGYDIEFEWTELFPFRSTTRYHDYHHEGNVKDNLADSTVIFDWIIGRNTNYYKHLQKLKKEKKLL